MPHFLHNATVLSNRPQDVITMRCPVCHHVGVLASILQDVWAAQVQGGTRAGLFFGLRQCPSPECAAAIFIVHDDGKVVASFPPELLDVDTTNLPELVLASLEEAVQCHAVGCYRAAAIMVRRTLEDVCADRGVTKGTLKDKIKALRTTVTLPQELLDGLDELRLLGNDAAHIEAQTYSQVGRDEIELAIEVVKLLLLSLYQTSHLIGRLRALQASQASPGTGST